MPVPFLNKHSEGQYLELEKHYLNLFNFLQSLLSITEGEDLDSDNQKLNHFGALCMRINQAVEEYADFTEKVQDVMFKGDSATTPPVSGPSGDVLIKVNKEEYGLILEALEHMAHSFPDLKIANEFQSIANDIRNLTKETEA
tara:strand:+ start:566 stop:991 length:426 start_codon:yes stop_codon:yes gene_type:complete